MEDINNLATIENNPASSNWKKYTKHASLILGLMLLPNNSSWKRVDDTRHEIYEFLKRHHPEHYFKKHFSYANNILYISTDNIQQSNPSTLYAFKINDQGRLTITLPHLPPTRMQQEVKTNNENDEVSSIIDQRGEILTQGTNNN